MTEISFPKHGKGFINKEIVIRGKADIKGLKRGMRKLGGFVMLFHSYQTEGQLYAGRSYLCKLDHCNREVDNLKVIKLTDYKIKILKDKYQTDH